MSRREQILKLAREIHYDADLAAVKVSDAVWLRSCNIINAAAADLVRLTKEEACSIMDSMMRTQAE